MNISQNLLVWYHQNRRDLPWRNVKNPYFIWVSEIILQQTRVAQGTAYYLRFINRFPDVDSLANASEDEVLKHWEGLGYYSRARNLHHAAKTIVEKFNGVFPHNYEQILALKGIGEYTAAAIASFAFAQRHAVIDGNVFRVLSRLYSIEHEASSIQGKKLSRQLAHEILNPSEPGLHNQAMMELGALVCTPTNPDCNACPVQEFCFAHKHNRINEFPVKKAKTKVQERFFIYFHIVTNDAGTIVIKRTENDIWKGLYEFPLIETQQAPSEFHAILNDLVHQFPFLQNMNVKTIYGPVKHILTHRHIFAWFVQINTERLNISTLPENWEYIQVSDLAQFAFPRIITRYLENT